MKKVICLVLITLFLIPAFAFSYEMAEKQDSSMGMGKGRMQGKMGMMQMMMMKKQMVSTPDGGVIVMSGNKLLKYDKDLNLTKEVEIKMDIEGMKTMMNKMKEKCSTYKQMKEEKEETTQEPKKE